MSGSQLGPAPEADVRASAHDWSTARRTHPGSIALWAIKHGGTNVLGIPAILAVVGGRHLYVMIYAAIILAAVTAISAILRWWRFTYRITENELVIEQGVFSRLRRIIPLERIQDVSIEQGLLARIFNLAIVRIETGGGEKDEGLLNSVSLQQAHILRDVLRSGTRTQVGGGGKKVAVGLEVNGEIVPVDDRLKSIYIMPIGRILLLGLLNYSLIWIAILASILQYAGGSFGLGFEEAIDLLMDAQDRYARLEHLYLWLGFGLILITLGAISGVARTLVTEWGFTLDAGAGRFRRVRGLFTRTEVVVAHRRVQMARMASGPIRRWLGWQSLSLQTLGGGHDGGGSLVLAPLARVHEVAVVLDHAGLPMFHRPPLVRVSRVYALTSFRRGLWLPIALMIAGWWHILPFYAGAVMLIVKLMLAALAPRYHRYGVHYGSLQVMDRIWRQYDAVVPLENIQGVILSQGPIQRRFGVVSVIADVAGGGGVRIDDLPQADGLALARTLMAGVN